MCMCVHCGVTRLLISIHNVLSSQYNRMEGLHRINPQPNQGIDMEVCECAEHIWWKISLFHIGDFQENMNYRETVFRV